MPTNRKYKCPYCNYRDIKEKLVSHVNKEHSDMIPENYTAARVVYNFINNRTSGSCIICHNVTEWDESRWKYKRLCRNPECKKKLSDIADKNMIKKYGKKNLLGDPKHQEKMMFNRSISGTYKFKDGGSKKYVGSYEKKALEFMDKILNISSDDIMVPGPEMTYVYNNEEHYYIPDMYYIPYNLIIEIKDGGSNPNKRNMESYREKQVAKEKEIIKDNKYNYIRLTNNEFDQLLSIFAELRLQMMSDDYLDKSKIIRIHEEVSGLAGCSDQNVYIIPYGYKNTFNNEDIEDYGYSIDFNSIIVRNDDNTLKKESFNDFLQNRSFNISTNAYSVNEIFTIDKQSIDYNFNIEESNLNLSLIDNGHMVPLLEQQIDYIAQDENGYFIYDKYTKIRTESYPTIEDAISKKSIFNNFLGGNNKWKI